MTDKKEDTKTAPVAELEAEKIARANAHLALFNTVENPHAEFDPNTIIEELEKKGVKKLTKEEAQKISDAYSGAMAKEGASAEGAMKAAMGEVEKLSQAVKAAEKGGWVARNFIKPSASGIGEEFSAAWKESKGRFAMKAGGTTLGVALLGHGGMRAFSKDEETGESHPVGGLIEAGAGAAVLAASLLARGKGGGAQVGV